MQDLPQQRQGRKGRRLGKPDGQRRRDLRVPRPVRVRQEHHPQDDQPPDRAHLGQGADQWRRHHRPGRGDAASHHRLCDPADRPVPQHDHRGEHHRGAASAGLGQAQVPRAGPRADEHDQARAQAVPAPLPA